MRSHYCGHVTETVLSNEVKLVGWVHRRRDHGGVIFVDLRDKTGLVQVVFNPDEAAMFAQAEKLRNEFVISVTGEVNARPEGMINPELATGQIEVVAKELTILNKSEPLPFQIDEYQHVGEEVRLKYRYLDLRRPEVLEKFRLRAKMASFIRRFYDANDFMDVETPFLTKATPEGARDYLVPSRTHEQSFFALPQSPQLFKQMLMMSGFDRYYQIVRCFRDEDLRADRQPEFTQLDVEMSFVEENDVMAMSETMVRELFNEVLDTKLPEFPRMTYAEAMRRFGSDKPDLRVELELIDVADIVKDVDFKVFSAPANDARSRVVVMRLPGGCELLTRKQLDDYVKFVAIYGAKGLAYIKVNDKDKGLEGLQSPILKFLDEKTVMAILERAQAVTGDIVFFGADKSTVVNEAMGAFRLKVAQDCNLVKEGWQPLWVTEFPMFEYDERQKRYSSLHHPFTAANVDELDKLESDPEHVTSRAYDMVLNGTEVGGGSIRIHSPEVQAKVFKILGISEDEASEKFGFFVNALKYGTPPHGGIAFGLDRLAMLMAGAKSIREVIAFPKTQTAACLLTDAPAKVSDAQLKECHIKVITKPKVEA